MGERKRNERAIRSVVRSLISRTGWVTAEQTWTYASATTFTVADHISGDRTVMFRVDTMIRLKQGGAYKYFDVISATSAASVTTVTVNGRGIYTLANAAITDNFYSYSHAPQGFPTWRRVYQDANGVTLNNGTSGDTVADLQVQQDGNTYHITEVTGVPGMQLEIDFTGIIAIDWIEIGILYIGGGTHYLNIELYNYDTTNWDAFATVANTFGNAGNYFVMPIQSDTNYISSGAAIVRINHPTTGNSSHDAFIASCHLVY